MDPYTQMKNAESGKLGIPFLPSFLVFLLGIAMIAGGALWLRKINKKRETLPDISKQLDSGEQVLETWPSEEKKGIGRKKFVILTLTNKRILTVNTDNKKIEYEVNLAGLTVIAKNRHAISTGGGGTGRVDSFGNVSTGPSTYTSRMYGDIDFFKDKVIVYHLYNIPDVDSVVQRIQQVQG